MGAAVLVGGDHLTEHRLVGADRGHVGAGEHADRIRRGDVREIGIADRQIALAPQRLLQQQARRQVRLDRDGLALEIAYRLDRAIRCPAVAAGRDVDRADDDPLGVLAPAEALVLADGAQITVDVAALHGREGVGHVVIQDLFDGDAFLREIAELVREVHRPEAHPHRIGAGDGVRVAHGSRGVLGRSDRQDQRRCEEQREHQLLACDQHGVPLSLRGTSAS